VGVTLDEISDGNRAAVLALRVAPSQEQFVSSVRESLAEAAECPHARPWYRTVVADGTPVGFVMVSWNAELTVCLVSTSVVNVAFAASYHLPAAASPATSCAAATISKFLSLSSS